MAIVIDGVELEPIKNFPHYLISKDGKIYSKYFNSFLVPHISMPTGYYQVTLCENKKRFQLNVHRLVAETYIPNPNKYKCVNHKDETRTNNNVENLEWCSYKYNVTYGHAIQKRMDHWTIEKLREYMAKAEEKHHRPVRNITTGEEFPTTEAAGKAVHRTHSAIILACQGETNKCAGYKWEYIERSN